MIRKSVKLRICTLLAAAMIIGTSGNAIAAEDRDKISKVYIDVDSDIKRNTYDADITITGRGSSYSIDEYEVINQPDDKWSGHDCPRIIVYITADDDNYFSSDSSSYIKLSGDADKVRSVKRENDKSYLIVTIDLKPIDQEIGNPTDLGWNSNGVAEWTAAYKGETYQAALYRDGSRVDTEETNKLNYDFSSKMTDAGSYTFRLRAVSAKSDYSDWVESPAYVKEEGALSGAASDTATPTASASGPDSVTTGEWQNDSNGWWFRNADGSWPAGTWMKISQAWYYFNESGYMLADTVTPDGYKVGADGAWIE